MSENAEPPESPETSETAERELTAMELAAQDQIMAIPTLVFYEDDSPHGRHLVRWAFCKEQDVLVEGLRRIQGADLHLG